MDLFIQVKQAYDVLNDPDKRAIYDVVGMKGLNTEGWEVRMEMNRISERWSCCLDHRSNQNNTRDPRWIRTIGARTRRTAIQSNHQSQRQCSIFPLTLTLSLSRSGFSAPEHESRGNIQSKQVSMIILGTCLWLSEWLDHRHRPSNSQNSQLNRVLNFQSEQKIQWRLMPRWQQGKDGVQDRWPLPFDMSFLICLGFEYELPFNEDRRLLHRSV